MAHIATEAPRLGALQVAERFGPVADMIAAGNPRAARRATETLVAAADDPTAEMLRTCLQALELSRPVAMARLRRLWQNATGDERALVEAVVPREPAPAARPAARPATAAAHAPREHSARHGAPRGSRSARETGAARSATRYFAEDAAPGGIDALTDAEPDHRGEVTEWVDEDLAAMLPLSGTPCVACWIERPTAEWRRRDDDGLCSDCRDRGLPGVPAAAEATRAGRLRARIAHIAGRAATDDQARSLLRGEYHRARGADKAVIVAWVHDYLPVAQPA